MEFRWCALGLGGWARSYEGPSNTIFKMKTGNELFVKRNRVFLTCVIPRAGAFGDILTVIILLVDIIVQMSDAFSEFSCYLKVGAALFPLHAEIQDWNQRHTSLRSVQIQVSSQSRWPEGDAGLGM